jgi:hypothetical protein
MENQRRRLIEKVTAPSYSEGLSDKPLAELRALREECREVENEISFERKLCHARIDILNAEIERRSGTQSDDLLKRLPEILGAEAVRSDSPLPERAPDLSIPRNADIPRRRVEEIVGEQTLARLNQLQVEEIRNIINNLGAHERNLSDRRKHVQEIMDSVQGEIVRRYTSGEEDPSAALA